MSIRIILENPPEFYTNLDVIRGQVILNLSRHESVSAVVVKLEGESRTALGVPNDIPGLGIARDRGGHQNNSSDVVHENHKILYKVLQVFPDERTPAVNQPTILNPGQHHFPFEFKFPFNNVCSNPELMSRIGGLVNPGGYGSGGLFGFSGPRVMDGTKQLLYQHVTRTLPPSFTGFPGEAEIRYYLKVTVQRPGIFKENWRYELGLKFLPIEPPRPPKTNQEAYARRPYTFQPRALPTPTQPRKRSGFFSWGSNSSSDLNLQTSSASSGPPPSIEMSARLPHPAILTCNKPIPLRLIAKKLVPSRAEVFLTNLEIDLVGKTNVRCRHLINTEISRWVVVARHGLAIPVSKPDDAVGTEVLVPNSLWSDVPLPNTVMPSFVTCNLSRDYQLELKIGLSWGRPQPQSPHFKGKNRLDVSSLSQELHLPLHFSRIEVYSGLTPPAALAEAAVRNNGRPKPQPSSRPAAASPAQAQAQAPPLPPRRPVPASQAQSQSQSQSQPQPSPSTSTQPQPQPQSPTQGQDQENLPAYWPPEPPYDDAPPTYEEAMAEMMTGPMFPAQARPAYSGVTDVNGPSTLPDGDAGNTQGRTEAGAVGGGRSEKR